MTIVIDDYTYASDVVDLEHYPSVGLTFGIEGVKTFVSHLDPLPTEMVDFPAAEISTDSVAAGSWVRLPVVVAQNFTATSTIRIGIQSGTTANVARYAYDVVTDSMDFYTDAFADGAVSTLPTSSADSKQVSARLEYDLVTGGGGGDPDPEDPGTGERDYIIGGRLYITNARSFTAGARETNIGGGF